MRLRQLSFHVKIFEEHLGTHNILQRGVFGKRAYKNMPQNVIWEYKIHMFSTGFEKIFPEYCILDKEKNPPKSFPSLLMEIQYSHGKGMLSLGKKD